MQATDFTSASKADAALALCPQCGAKLPRPDGFPVWCEKCDWNVDPTAKSRDPLKGLARVYERLGAQLSKELFESVTAEAEIRPGRSLSSLLAIALAVLIHLLTFVLLISGLWLLIAGWPNAFAIAVAVVLLGSAWLTRPRFGEPPEDLLERQRWPAIHQFVDRVADEVGAQRIDGIAVTPEFNASISQGDWSGARYLRLGLPLMTVLTAQERVALLSHEFAHGVNGDPARGVIVSSAINALIHWVYIIRPQGLLTSDLDTARSGGSLIMLPVNLVTLAASELLLGTARLLVALLYRDSQRAEYYADLIATRVSGVDAMVSTLRKLFLAESLEWVMHRYANFRTEGEDLFANMRSYAQQIPAREIERLRRLGVKEDARVDASHPPTAHRIAVVEHRGSKTPLLVASESDNLHFQAELAQFEAAMSRVIAERYDAALWR